MTSGRVLLMSSAIMLAGLWLAGCGSGPTYGGGSSHSYGNPDRETVTSVETQRDPGGRLLFFIAWTNKHGGWHGPRLRGHDLVDYREAGDSVWNERCHGLTAGQAMREHNRGLTSPDHGTRLATGKIAFRVPE